MGRHPIRYNPPLYTARFCSGLNTLYQDFDYSPKSRICYPERQNPEFQSPKCQNSECQNPECQNPESQNPETNIGCQKNYYRIEDFTVRSDQV